MTPPAGCPEATSGRRQTPDRWLFRRRPLRGPRGPHSSASARSTAALCSTVIAGSRRASWERSIRSRRDVISTRGGRSSRISTGGKTNGPHDARSASASTPLMVASSTSSTSFLSLLRNAASRRSSASRSSTCLAPAPSARAGRLLDLGRLGPGPFTEPKVLLHYSHAAFPVSGGPREGKSRQGESTC